MAPEVKKNQNLNNIPYNPFKADIYSLGVLFCEIIGNNPKVTFNLDKLKGKTKIDPIIKNCLENDPSKRNDISSIIDSLQKINT